ncbi:hypothetical protein TruAng_006475 [Truncatella angustata]|nr:hypothetical protein TruAng_006475 [Truncatella angustata]
MSPRGKHNAQPAGAASMVFTTWELVEIIMLHLEMRELLVTGQRINVFCHTVVQKSALLQQRLFFQPVAEEMRCNVSSSGDVVANPLLADHFYQFFQDLPATTSWGRAPNDGEAPQHKSLRRSAPLLDLHPTRREAALNRRGASWRSMLLSQPPPTRLEYLTWARKGWRSKRGHAVVVSRDAPVRMGAVYDLAYYALWRTGAMSVRWRCYAQFFGTGGLPLFYELHGVDAPFTEGFMTIRIGESKAFNIATGGPTAPLPYRLHYIKNHKSMYQRLLTLIHGGRNAVGSEEDCLKFRSEDYNQNAVVQLVLPDGVGIADLEYHSRVGRYALPGAAFGLNGLLEPGFRLQ